MNNPTDNILFRCSRLGDLVTEAKKKGEELGETAKTYIRQVWLEKEFGYKEEVLTDEMMKGHLCEQDSLGLVQSVLKGEFRAKNTLKLKNEFIAGTPDIILKKEDVIEDVKSSWNLRTFTEAELIKNYFWQGQGYMWLTGKKNYRLIYCLVPTPEEILVETKKKIYYKFNCDESNPHYIQMCAQIDHNNNVINSIPAANRIKVFEFAYDQEKIDSLIKKIEAAREHYKTLSLPGVAVPA
ncbi:hypothetical protein [Dyadobacter sandarakinus]|uniref:Uncharacterized protein n=1 Tax=Dyadobacter sandarakinus TaxID=2747268 RepID=A0ABX7I107_9BACT|nr:hypothetical protein [Dyadobacter sandarakinus]QRQ99746.1 hypothetical protein HWI92_01840 [Dyadobacter sandarakinus]